MWVALRAEIDWIKHTWCLYTLMWRFPWENGSNMHKTPTTQPFSFTLVAMNFLYHLGGQSPPPAKLP